MPDPVSVNSMFARIARRYDLANRLLSGGMDLSWRRRLVAEVNRCAPRQLLDLATGSGDVAFALADGVPTAERIVALDFCEPMLAEARRKQDEAGRYPKIAFGHGDILALPVEAGAFDAATLSFGLRNLADRAQGLREIHRTLRPGGRLYVLEFSRPYRWFEPFYLFYLRHLLPRIAGWLTGDRAAYDYLNQTIEAFPDHVALAEEFRLAGFREVTALRMTFGIVALHEATR
jgi:demethylmenaquinone methyltransferase/2-methoxy-6-polyprenyl-1,4-benzoquinol methylase